MKQDTIHLSFTSKERHLKHELLRESALTYVPIASLCRKYMKLGMKYSKQIKETANV